MLVFGCRARSTGVGPLPRTCAAGEGPWTGVQRWGTPHSPLHDPQQLSSALSSPNLAVWRVGDTCWGAGSRRAPPPLPGPPPASPPALPRSGPALAAAASRAASERTEAGGARGGRSARQGTLRREPSRDRGRPRGGLNGRSAVETPGAAGRARLVSVAAGSRGAGEETPASPAPSRGLSRGSSVPAPPRF